MGADEEPILDNLVNTSGRHWKLTLKSILWKLKGILC